MKKIFFAFVAALLCTSCLVNEKETPVLNGAYEKFYAVIEDGLSKVYADNELNVRWNADDRISVFNKTTGNQPFAFQGADGDLSGEFTPAGEPAGGTAMDKVYAVYPYDSQTAIDGSGTITLKLPAHQRYRENSFGSEANTMVSAGGDNNLLFKNLCGYLALKLYGDDVTVSSISLRGNNGERLSGKCAVTCAPGEDPSLVFDPSGTFEISLGFDTPVALGSSAEDATTFWLVVPPVSFSGGFTLTVHDNSGSIFKKSTSEELTISRNTLSRMKALKVEPAPQAVAEAVDLGLSVKWASFNLGATKPEEIGDYYAWGETESKEEYDWQTYKFGLGTECFSKYVTDSEYGPVDNKTILEPEDDAATVNWGGSWRMPTIEEQCELLKCTWEWTTQEGINGYKVIGSNGNFIFLPAAGFREGTNLNYVGSHGFYWSSSADVHVSDYVFGLHIEPTKPSSFEGTRIPGRTIRPVTDEGIRNAVTGIEMSRAKASLVLGGNLQLAATIKVQDSGRPATAPAIIWSSNNTDVATVTYTGIVTAVSSGTAIITATAYDTSAGNFSTSCEITITETAAAPEIVDLGLSVNWASFNVGACAPEDYGTYFAWGEIAPKSTYYWNTYKWCDGSSISLTKYCTDNSYGTVDDKSVLESVDDAATANWGDGWRMPTRGEINELRENCTWEKIIQNGVNGYKVTGPSGNSIFLPASGERIHTRFLNTTEFGYYASSSLASNCSKTNCLFFRLDYDSSYATELSNDRYYGISIRPVCTKTVVSLNKETAQMTVGSVMELSLQVYPENAIVDLSELDLQCGDALEFLDIQGEQIFIRALAPGISWVSAWLGGKFAGDCRIDIHEEYAEPEPVDLGLSVKWASFNLGAWAPEDAGCHYAWGETAPKDYYDWDNYTFGGGYGGLTKYCTVSYYGQVDGKTVLETEDDAASVNLGGNWRMPTADEFVELYQGCSRTWTTLCGVQGGLFTSKRNGNSIFLPATVFQGYYESEDFAGVRWWSPGFGVYWTSSLAESYPATAEEISIAQDLYLNSGYYFAPERSSGFSIRPVCP